MPSKVSAKRKEFTLRNKATNPILTLAPHVLKCFLVSRSESVALVLAKYLADYKALTGRKVTLTYEQESQLRTHFGANERGQWASSYSTLPELLTRVKTCFQDGFMYRTISNGLMNDLALAEEFFDMLDTSRIP